MVQGAHPAGAGVAVSIPADSSKPVPGKIPPAFAVGAEGSSARTIRLDGGAQAPTQCGCGPTAFPVLGTGAPLSAPAARAPWPPCNIPALLLPPLITKHPPRKTCVPQAPRARGLCCCLLQSPTSLPAPGKGMWCHQRDLGRDDAAPSPPATVCAAPQDLFAYAPSDVRINPGAMLKLGEHGATSSPQLSPPHQPSLIVA